MPRPSNPNALEWETVELQLTGGVDLNDPGRAIPQNKMLELENARFEGAAFGLKRRRGHKGYLVRNNQAVPNNLTLNPGDSTYSEGRLVPPDGWVFGLGYGEKWPQAGFIAGVATRDKETVAWDGYRLFSWGRRADGNLGWQNPVACVAPHLRTEPMVKTPTAMTNSDAGVGDKIRVVAWTVGNNAYVSVVDHETGAPYLNDYALPGVAGTLVRIKVVGMGPWVHVLVSSTANVYAFSVHEETPWTVSTMRGFTSRPCASHFDARKLTDDLWVVVMAQSAANAKVTFLNGTGTVNTSYCSDGTVLATATNPDFVSIAQHQLTKELCLAWRTVGTTNYYATLYTPNGVAQATTALLDNECVGLTVAARYETAGVYSGSTPISPERGTFDVYGINQVVGGAYFVRSSSVKYVAPFADVTENALCWHIVGASEAFTVGNETYFVAKSVAFGATTLQQTFYVLDRNLKPVGRFELFNAGSRTATNHLNSAQFKGGQGLVNRFVHYIAYVRRQRLDSANNDQYDEDTLKLATIDFLPPFRTAQLGRTLYIAGAQLQAYDGHEVVEAGFHIAPEKVVYTDGGAAGGGGGLTGTYQYIVRMAYKNAQGEEVVGPAIASTTGINLTGRKASVTWNATCLTRRTNVYYLVYRRTALGTSFYLVSNRDPSVTTGDNDCPINDRTAASISFVDDLSDVSIESKERDRLESGLMEPFSGSACEAVFAGRDRLWLIGGEIEPGTVMPSLVYSPDARVETAQFNPFLATPIDRGAEPITAIGFLGHSVLIFKKHRIYAIEADGPDNLGNGAFDYPRLLAADIGAITPEGITLTSAGVLFVSPTGVQLLATNYQVIDVGRPVSRSIVDSAISAAVLVPEDEEVRFYCYNGPAYVFNYRTGEWATWTGLECSGAVLNPVTGLAALGRLDGWFWNEDEAEYTDAGAAFRFRVRLAWLRGDVLGFIRVRSAAIIGDRLGAHTLTCRVFYDDRDFPEDEWTWDPDTDLIVSLWGDGLWGDGEWGDVNDTVHTDMPNDTVYQLKRRLKRQKCSRVSLEITDSNSGTPGASLSAVAFEIGRRGGTARIPARSYT